MHKVIYGVKGGSFNLNRKRQWTLVLSELIIFGDRILECVIKDILSLIVVAISILFTRSVGETIDIWHLYFSRTSYELLKTEGRIRVGRGNRKGLSVELEVPLGVVSNFRLGWVEYFYQGLSGFSAYKAIRRKRGYNVFTREGSDIRWPSSTGRS